MDNLLDLLFFIIFILIVASNIFLKQKRKPRKTTESQPGKEKPGWRKVMEDILNDIREQMEEGAEPSTGKPSRRGSGWEDIILPKQKDWETAEEIPKPKEKVSMRPAPVPDMAPRESDFDELRLRESQPMTREGRLKQLKERKPSLPVSMPTHAKPGIPGIAVENMSVDDLRNAVIWHEILSPPLALRDD